MRQANLKLKRYASSINIVNNNNLERRILNIALVSLGALAFLYVLLLGNTVWNIVERRSLEVNLRSLSSEVADLELTYFSMSNKVDASLGYALGFSEKEAKYTTRKSLGSLPSVNLSKNEI